MILFEFWRRTLSGPHLTVNAGRWVFEVCTDHIGFSEQRRHTESDTWGTCGHYYWLAWTAPPGPWRGYHGVQYDGYHESFGVGFICLTWCNSFDGTSRESPWRSAPLGPLTHSRKETTDE